MDPGRLWDASGRPLDGRSCPGSVRPLAGLDALGPRHRSFATTGYTGSCQNDNFRPTSVENVVYGKTNFLYSQWRPFRQHDSSVIPIVPFRVFRFNCIFLNDYDIISMKISLKFVPKCPIDNQSALVQIMAWRRIGESRYLNQWRLVYWRIYASFSPNELTESRIPVSTIIPQPVSHAHGTNPLRYQSCC